MYFGGGGGGGAGAGEVMLLLFLRRKQRVHMTDIKVILVFQSERLHHLGQIKEHVWFRLHPKKN